MGGITTVVDMPLNSFPVTTTLEQLQAKQALLKVGFGNANGIFQEGTFLIDMQKFSDHDSGAAAG